MKSHQKAQRAAAVFAPGFFCVVSVQIIKTHAVRTGSGISPSTQSVLLSRLVAVDMSTELHQQFVAKCE